MVGRKRKARALVVKLIVLATEAETRGLEEQRVANIASSNQFAGKATGYLHAAELVRNNLT